MILSLSTFYKYSFKFLNAQNQSLNYDLELIPLWLIQHPNNPQNIWDKSQLTQHNCSKLYDKYFNGFVYACIQALLNSWNENLMNFLKF